jgi:hypothetical protein
MKKLIAIGAALFAVVACAKPPPVVSTAELTSGELDAAYRMAVLQCDRDLACKMVTAESECIHDRTAIAAAEAEIENCSSQIDERNLHTCLNAVEQTSCGKRIRDIPACARERLCPSLPQEGTI